MIRAVPFVTSILLIVITGVPAAELPRVAPKAVGLSETTLDEVQPGLAKLADDDKIAGAVAVVVRPTVPVKGTMLVRHLFAHTSGFSYGFAMKGTETERRMVRAYSKANLSGRGLKTIAELPVEQLLHKAVNKAVQN